jgi:hypothetical protein
MESLRKAITRAATPASIIGTVVNEEGYRNASVVKICSLVSDLRGT